MDLKTWISEKAPEPVATRLRDVYYTISSEPDPRFLRQTWKASNPDYDSVVSELLSSKYYDELISTIEEMTNSGEIGVESAHDIYYLIRKRKPECVVETGVCNGMSSSIVLLAMQHNGKGELHSIDFPIHSDIPYEQRQKKDIWRNWPC